MLRRTRLLALAAMWPAAAASESLRFEPNHGQFDAEVLYAARGGEYSIALLHDGAAIRTTDCGGGASIRLTFAGSRRTPVTEGIGASGARANYFLGAESARWRRGIPSFERVRYRDLYPGIDLVWYGSEGRLEHDFVVRPGADPGAIRVRVESREAPRLDRAGCVVIGSLRLDKPRARQQDGRPVEVSYRRAGRREFRLAVGRYDRAAELVIDPLLVYATSLGGSGRQESVSNPRCYWDTPTAIAVDAEGNVYVAGYTPSADFPIADGLDEELTSFWDVFVAKFDPGGRLLYSTYLGGATDNLARDLALDPHGDIVITGSTGCDFPAVGPLQECRGRTDAFVLKLSADGGRILFSTFLGGQGEERGQGLGVDAGGDIYVAGWTNSSDFPVTAGVIRTAPADGFVARIGSGGMRLVYSTYFDAEVTDMAVTADGRAFLTGATPSEAFPTTPGAFQRSYAGGGDAFLAGVDAEGARRLFATLLGGAGADRGSAIALDEDEDLFVAGSTGSTDFPTTGGAWQRELRGSEDVFVMKLDAGGTKAAYSTLIGGGESDAATSFRLAEAAAGVAVDASGHAYVVGTTASRDFPLVRPIQSELVGERCLQCPRSFFYVSCTDAFVTKLAPDGSGAVYSTFLGGVNLDRGRAIAADARSNAYIAANADPHAPQTRTPHSGNSWDRIFIAKIADDGSEPPELRREGVVNAASFASGVTPGGVASLFGRRLTEARGVVAAAELPPYTLAGTTVMVNGMPAPLYAVAGLEGWDQVNLQAPYETEGEVTVLVQRGTASAAVTGIPDFAVQPGLFTVDGVYAAAQHAADYAPITEANPARPGEAIVLWATGLGRSIPPVATGAPGPGEPLSVAASRVRVFTSGAVEFDMLFAGLAPRLVGVYQINARLPESLPYSGDLDVVLMVDDRLRSNVVKLPVRRP